MIQHSLPKTQCKHSALHSSWIINGVLYTYEWHEVWEWGTNQSLQKILPHPATNTRHSSVAVLWSGDMTHAQHSLVMVLSGLLQVCPSTITFIKCPVREIQIWYYCCGGCGHCHYLPSPQNTTEQIKQVHEENFYPQCRNIMAKTERSSSFTNSKKIIPLLWRSWQHGNSSSSSPAIPRIVVKHSQQI